MTSLTGRHPTQLDDTPKTAERICPGCGEATARYSTNRTRYCRACYHDRYYYSLNRVGKCPQCGGRMRSDSKLCRKCRVAESGELRVMRPEEIAWVAGIIEGEGTFRATKSRGITVAMTDRDIIERLKIVTGVGRIYAVARQKAHHKDSFIWCVSCRDHYTGLALAILPWLGERRNAAARRLIEGVSVTPAGLEPAFPE